MSFGYHLVLPTTKVYKIVAEDDEERRKIVEGMCEQWSDYCNKHWLSDDHEKPYCGENRVKRFLDGLAYFLLIGNMSEGIVTEYMEKINRNREIPVSCCPSFVEDIFYGGGTGDPTDEDMQYIQHLCDKLEEASQRTRKGDRVVYRIKNTINGRSYIGITRGLDERWQQHLRAADAGESHPLYEALREFGVEKFTVDVIDTVDTTEELEAKARLYIRQYETLYPYGYNVSPNGETPTARREKPPTLQPVYDKIHAFTNRMHPVEFMYAQVDTENNFVIGGCKYHIDESCSQYAPKETKVGTLYDMDKVTIVRMKDGELRFFDTNFDEIGEYVDVQK